MNDVDACRAVLIEVLTILAKDLDKLAREFRGKTDDKLIAEGIGILPEKFERLDSIGPVWAAQTAEEATAGTGFDIEMEQRRAYEIVNALLREIESVSSK